MNPFQSSKKSRGKSECSFSYGKPANPNWIVSTVWSLVVFRILESAEAIETRASEVVINDPSAALEALVQEVQISTSTEESHFVPGNARELYQGTITNWTSVDSVSLECGLWIAPSAIPGAGLGMYAGRDFKENDLLQDVGDLCIPIVDIREHQMDENLTLLFDDYVWDTVGISAGYEGFHQVSLFSPGLGSLPNSLPIVNVDLNAHATDRDYAGLHRASDPGAGAFSPYYDRVGSAMRNIKAGEELYLSYGADWFEARPEMGPVPLPMDLDTATEFFREFLQMSKPLVKLSDYTMRDFWDTFVASSPFKSSRVLGIFNRLKPDEMAELERGKSISQIMIQKSVRSKDWLEQHGTCGDHLRPGSSTLTQAGHGAFANRDLPRGTLVARLPLIHVTNRSRFNMYGFIKGDPTIPSLHGGQLQPQLVLNYCYGHKESTLLLCPYGPMVNYINHNQTQVNVRIKWADPSNGYFMHDLLNASLKELESLPKVRLSFDLVATRNIEEGEEVYLDYGDEWEQAWQKHVDTWSPVDGAHEFQSVDELNDQLANEEFPLYSELDYLKNPNLPRIPPNVELSCNNFFADNTWKLKYKIGELVQVLEDYENQAEYLPCNILRTSLRTREMMYTVKVLHADNHETEIWEDCPYNMFRFNGKPYTSDIFLVNAFRHDIRVPDEIFPNSWRNLSPIHV